ncbi:MAG: mechanosensitive ion channel family protein [Candidatus Omnitrophica bacterium]|nr:mechanosensitive ion channel family protein [Candidatus Omnitrophota bacterium]MDD5355988.1 mechanosensitive ion channel family protein [Candidatus Omnitrophota bacterium]
MGNIRLFNVEISIWLYAPVLYLIWVAVLFSIKKMFFYRIKEAAKKTKTQLDDVLLNALNKPLALLIFTSGFFILERALPASRYQQLHSYLIIALRCVTILAVILFLENILEGLVRAYSNKVAILKNSKGVVVGIIRTVVIGLGLLILLDSFGISITPLLASLGIGSLAVALALQPTLENFFSGVQLVIDKTIKVGQFIKLESGEEGYVHKIGWRSSWIRMLPNNTVVIPNKVLVSSKVLNYYYPETEMAVLVEVGVHYDSDLEKVEKVTVEVAKEVMNTVTGGVASFEPFIRFHTFDDFSINFTVILRCKEFVDNYLIKHEFIKRLHKRYAKEGITIPYPIRAINYSQEKSQE